MGGKKFIRHGRLDEVTQKGKSLLWYYIQVCTLYVL